MNQRVTIRRPGGLDQIMVQETPDPVPGKGEALVRVTAAGVAFGDVMLRHGIRGGRFPATPGYDLAGVVEALGPSTTGIRVGDHVIALPGIGTQQQFICLAAGELLQVPSDLPPEKTVALVLNYVTAIQLLTRVANLKSGDTAFVYGLAGGLGCAMTEVARELGIRLFGTASGERLEQASRGATAFDRADPKWTLIARQKWPDGFDAVFDPIGGASLTRSFGLLAPRGTLVMLGASGAVQGEGDQRLKLFGTVARMLWLKLRSGPRRVRMFIVTQAKARHPKQFRKDLGTLVRWLAEGKIDPAIHAALPLQGARLAQEMLECSQVAGKVVLKPSSAPWIDSQSVLRREDQSPETVRL